MELIGEIRQLVERYVEHKITQACLPDAICNDIEDMTADAIENIDDLLNELDKNIDNTIENFDREEEIKNIRDDIRTQDYLERNLFD
jgi:F0F1-type ATP synthase gamma subunit